MEIVKIEVSTLSTDELQNLYIANCRVVEKYGFLKRHRDADEYKNSFLTTFIESDNELYVVKDGSQIFGILSLIKSADWSGKEQYKLTIHLCESVITKPVAEGLRQFIHEKSVQYSYFAIIAYNDEPDVLLEKFSCKVQYRGEAYILDKRNIDADLPDKTVAKLSAKNNDLRIVYTDAITEEYIEQYCNLFTELHEEMPDVAEEAFVQYIINPEKQRQMNEANAKKNITHHCYMIFNEDNEMIAMTNVSVNNNDPRFPYQFFICVREQYRSRGLGKWLYAAMYKKILENVDFEKMLVHHHPTNMHAANISKWIGYKFSYLETTYLVG